MLIINSVPLGNTNFRFESNLIIPKGPIVTVSCQIGQISLETGQVNKLLSAGWLGSCMNSVPLGNTNFPFKSDNSQRINSNRYLSHWANYFGNWAGKQTVVHWEM